MTTLQLFFAKKRGFCSGVKRAIDISERCLAEKASGHKIYVYHEIVHNKIIVDRLREQGITFIDDLSGIPQDAPTDSYSVIFSAHGVSPVVCEQAKSRNMDVIDATCPLVDRVHMRARQYLEKGYQIIYIGHKKHDEVIGVLGEDRVGKMFLVGNKTDVDALVGADNTAFSITQPVVWLSQTTLSLHDTNEIVQYLRGIVPHIEEPASECICRATTERQNAALELVREVGNGGLIIVVGSANSSNTMRLADLAGDSALHGVEVTVWRIDSVGELDLAKARQFARVGITSGASVPEDVTNDIVNALLD